MRKEIEEYINYTYGAIQEYPWNKFPNHTTFKHKNNKKWFAIIMQIPYRKLNIEKDGIVDIINVKNVPQMIGSLRKHSGIFPAYHMNKEHWITILLDKTVSKEDICKLIDISFELTDSKLK